METYIIIFLCIASFIAGFIDAIVGGGGLIQTPAALNLLPNVPVASIIGTLKIPGFSGTSIAAYQYLKKVKIDWKLFVVMAIISFSFSFLGGEKAVTEGEKSVTRAATEGEKSVAGAATRGEETKASRQGRGREPE